MSNESNGHGQYQSEVYYEYPDADVWYKITENNVEIVYTEDILAELFGEDDSESEPDKSN